MHSVIPDKSFILCNFPFETIQKIDRVLKKSVEFAFAFPESSMPFTKSNAQEMDEDVMKKHIELYVNEFSIHLGAEGRRAVELLFTEALDAGLISSDMSTPFID